MIREHNTGKVDFKGAFEWLNWNVLTVVYAEVAEKNKQGSRFRIATGIGRFNEKKNDRGVHVLFYSPSYGIEKAETALYPFTSRTPNIDGHVLAMLESDKIAASLFMDRILKALADKQKQKLFNDGNVLPSHVHARSDNALIAIRYRLLPNYSAFML